MRRSYLALTFLVVSLTIAAGAQPREIWKYDAGQPITQSPLLGDFTGSTGQELVYVADSPLKIVCLSSRGEIVWDAPLEENAAVTAAPAATLLLPQRDALIAVAGDRDLACFFANGGRRYWRELLGPASPGGLMWLDLEGDFREELVYAAEGNTIYALTAEGTELWRYAELDHGHDLKIAAPMAGGDINNDKLSEVVVPLDDTVVALDSFGVLLWETSMKREIGSAPVILDADRNALHEIYILTQNPAGVLCLDADLGTERWFVSLADAGLEVRRGESALIAADLDQDGQFEIAAGGANGKIAALSVNGALLWTHDLRDSSPVFPAAADLNGDLRVEILAASAGGTLAQFGPWGHPHWSRGGEAGYAHPAMIADVNSDATPDIVTTEKPGVIRCMQIDANYTASLNVWPMAGQSAARTRFARDVSEWKTNETERLLINGDFEYAADKPDAGEVQPHAWTLDSAAGANANWGLAEDRALSGKKALWLASTGDAPAAVAQRVPLPPGLASVAASIHQSGGNSATVTLRWESFTGDTLREDALRTQPADGGWTRHFLNSTVPPAQAFAASFVIQGSAGTEEKTWWDNAVLDARVAQVPVVEIFYNQFGYESYAPKKFVVRANWLARDAKFAIVNLQGEPLFDGKLGQGARFVGGGGVEWPGYYWRGDFTEFYGQSLIRIGVELDEVQVFSPVVELGLHAVWDRAAPLALRALSAALCGGDAGAAFRTEMDGGVQLTPEFFWELAQIRRVCKWRFEKIDLDKNGTDDFLQMLQAVAVTATAALREDGSCDPAAFHKACGVDAPEHAACAPEFLAAGLSRLAMQVDNPAPEYIDAASRVLERLLNTDKANPFAFAIAVDLYVATQNLDFSGHAAELLPSRKFDGVAQAIATDAPDARRAGDLIESFVLFESHLTDEPITFLMSVDAAGAADEMVRQARNPFGVFMYALGEELHCFPPPGPEANHTRHILEAASFVAQVYRYQPKQEYYAFVMDQLNWVFGCNPFGVCLAAGTGKRLAPEYAVPHGLKRNTQGLLPRGPAAAGPGDDRPFFSLKPGGEKEQATNEVDLYSTVTLLGTLAHIKRMPVGPDDK